MENIYTILEKLKQVTDRTVMEGEIPAGLKAYQDKKPGKKSDDNDTKASNGKMPMDAGKDGKMGTKDDKPAFLKKESVAKDNMQEDDGIFADTALSMDKLAKLKEVEETASTIRTQLKDAMMSRLAELAGVPLAEIEEAVGESTQDAASRIKSEVVLDDEEVKEGDDFMSTDPKGAWKAIAARKEELVDQGMEPEEAQDQAAEEIGVDPEELEAWLATNESVTEGRMSDMHQDAQEMTRAEFIKAHGDSQARVWDQVQSEEDMQESVSLDLYKKLAGL